MKFTFACLALLIALLLGGCVTDADEQSFYYRGWTRPKMSPDDKAYFYGGKGKRGAGPEAPVLPNGEVSQ